MGCLRKGLPARYSSPDAPFPKFLFFEFRFQHPSLPFLVVHHPKSMFEGFKLKLRYIETILSEYSLSKPVTPCHDLRVSALI